ncbi:putative phage-like protein YoqJ [Streptohalobacillus salinus]|uniref:Putative phage-like protein YoqJ n=1 Tax=Streptohalobacillus salinus TaxID=621096 RepID=A0A2V3WBB7_9BACI|nr:SLOG family protein [Streptohalobacillus salinus]PXW91757.1 putative phage-like protein YoqJ [Streptohalobacillus salinus]
MIMTVTGYKSFEMGIHQDSDPRIDYVKHALKQKIVTFIEQGGQWVLTSGQLGVELWAVEVVLDLQVDYQVQVAIIPPFDHQDARWNEANQEKYQHLTEMVDYYQLLYQGDYKNPGQFKAKNKFFLDKSDVSLILVDDINPGSVKYYLDEAKRYQKANKQMLEFITPLDLDDVVRELTEDF